MDVCVGEWMKIQREELTFSSLLTVIFIMI